MKPLGEVAGRTLTWERRSPFRREFDLRADGDVVATLRVGRGWRSPALGVFAHGSFSLERARPWVSRVTVRMPDGDVDLAVFEPEWWGQGTLEFARGGHFKWKRAGFWSASWRVTDFEGTPLVTFRRRLSWLKGAIRVDVESAAWSMAELPMLLLFAEYQMLHRARRG